ncbi:Ribosome biogenesis protein BMS1 like protein [Trachymyrmex zeteki]|uniref:Ribosome biogenesis protein BMS1 like protein n=1 Tax=Mycetomoellerius zeteki TaxID=64791 RepID=A0A151WT24_9HYME|nr:PREDICTED: ribosome biogenesis protein BMS1 homolog [Trachymyrmex zeteki]XP_018309767.1 PREDICTED: ribosome biogenesis protein BMS1 homolog [Trachymyrmex zeteki]XP_018309768.1 PREDICTED: ribosome biogenesis protein BMS1 homolog [Trachymyrmex zeteki]KYQ50988.1 Ribosome biogenesis protein BMS1 like protein [Trachymyrmex zeteki]
MSSAMDDTVKHKSHRDRNAGRKAEKKKTKKEHVQELSDKQRNPKAFTFNSAIRAERRFRRKQDIETKKQHIPLVDRTPLEPPPVLVAVVGPPKVGKSLVIQCLIKSYVKQPLTNILGPVTVVSGKKRRITFIECNNDVNCMIDIAKVADLVLLLVDASFGFEMEIFEFLNICQVHGMPRIMGVLTHLDLIKNASQMRKTKKTLKHRFWTEVFAGAKLFYLSGLLHEEYLRTEIKNLARFISVMRFRPLTWRTTHPYLLADRLEDLTSPEFIRKNPKVDRNICLYGYVRGIPLNKDTSIHIPGCGDMKVKDVNFLPDPCPLPEHIKKRALVEKERLIYAPFSGVGGIVYDKDAVYVELGGSHSYKEEDTGLAGALMDTQETLDEKLQHSELKLFSDAAPIKSQDVNESMVSYTGELVTENARVRRKVIFKDETDVKNVSNKDDDDNLVKHEDEDSEDDENNEDDSNDDNDYNDDMDENDDDEDEWSDVETLEKTEKGVKRKSTNEGNIQKKKKRDSVNSTIENDVDLDESELTNDKKIDAPQENAGVYHSLSKESDKLIKNKISEALSLLEATKKNVKQDVDDESFDELSDEDSRAGLEMDADRFSDFEDIAFEEEDKGEEKGDIKMDESEEVPDELKWKRNLTEKAREAFINRQQSNKNLMKIVYGVFDKSNMIEEEEDKEDEKLDQNIGGIFRVIQEQQKQKIQERELQNQEESVFFPMESSIDWLKEENKALLINRFVTGKWKESEDAEELLKLDDEDLYGDFEDLETGEKHKAEHPEELPADEMEEKKELLEKKKKLKEQFNVEYDNTEKKTYYDELKDEVERQASINKSEFEGLDDDIRVQLEGYRPGMYVRVEIEAVPCELITHLDPTYPIIIGGLLHGEENIGYVQTRIKKHRWYSRILKSRDPLVFSIGWRRFQSLPIYSKLEDNLRHRMLKYTPEHVACMGHLWGPITPQGTGVLAVQDVASKEPGFRIVATGSIVELGKSTEVMKKLKLIGVPMKIHRKTAFIKDMFNSALEIAKFEGARIKTVSGIRGQIKKAISKPEGCFRATFEDKIMLSDIVFCRTWYKIDVPRFYNPVTSLLLPPAEKSRWRGMKTTGQLKREKNIHAEANMNSIYTPVKRDVKVFKPLFIPRKLQKELPYRDKPKLESVPHLRKPKFKQGRVAVVREPQEQNIARIIKMIRTNYAQKQKQSKKAMTKRITAYQAQIKEEEDKKLKKQKQMKKEIFRDLSKLEKKKSR